MEAGNFAYQNYRQSLGILETNKKLLDDLEKKIGTTSADYERYLEEEKLYLQSRKVEPAEVLETVDYMEKLQKLDALG